LVGQRAQRLQRDQVKGVGGRGLDVQHAQNPLAVLQHPVGVKAVALEVGLLRGPEDQLPARDGGVTVHSGVLEVSPDGLGRVGIGDVDHPLAPLQALEEEGGDQRPVLFF